MTREDIYFLIFHLCHLMICKISCVNQVLFYSPCLNALWMRQWWGSLLLWFLSHHSCWPDVRQGDPEHGQLTTPQDMVRQKKKQLNTLTFKRTCAPAYSCSFQSCSMSAIHKIKQLKGQELQLMFTSDEKKCDDACSRQPGLSLDRICQDFQGHQHLELLPRMMQTLKKENCSVEGNTLCVWERKGGTAWLVGSDRKTSQNAKDVEPWGRWATTTKDHIRFHYIFKKKKLLSSMVNLNFCWGMHLVYFMSTWWWVWGMSL